MKAQKIAFIFLLTLSSCLVACQQATSPTNDIDNASLHETDVPYHSETQMSQPSEGTEQETEPQTEPETEPQTEPETEVQTEPEATPETQPTTQSPSDDAFCQGFRLYENMDKFLEDWWANEIPNRQGNKKDTIVVPVLKLDNYKSLAVKATPDVFFFYYWPNYRESVAGEITVEIRRWDIVYETGTFDRSFPYSDDYQRAWYFRAYDTNPRVFFPESVYPQTEEDLEKIITFEVHTRPETVTTAEAETDAVP